MTSWVSVSRVLPPLDTAVWLYDEPTGDMWVGVRFGCGDKEWAWGRSSGDYWRDDSVLRWDCDLIVDVVDDSQPTHWAPLITPPSLAVGEK